MAGVKYYACKEVGFVLFAAGEYLNLSESGISKQQKLYYLDQLALSQSRIEMNIVSAMRGLGWAIN